MKKFLPLVLLALFAMPDSLWAAAVNGPPTLTSITRLTPATSPTNADTLVFRATFNEEVTTVTTGNFAVVVTGLTAPTITGVTSNGNGLSWDFTLTGGTLASGNGTVQLNLANNTNIFDFDQGFGLVTTTLAGEVYTIDNAVATLTLSSITDDTGASSSDFITNDAQLSYAGTGAEAGATIELRIDGGAPLANPSGPEAGGGWGFNNTTNTLTPGVHTVEFRQTDAAGNVSNWTSSQNITIDQTGPTVTLTSATTSPTNSTSFTVNINFNEDVFGFAIGDMTVSNGSLSAFNTVSASSYTVTLTPTAPGTVQVNLAGGGATDTAGNGNQAATAFSITFDNVRPNVAVNTGTADPTNLSSIPFTIVFDEAVTGLLLSEVTVTNGTASNLQNPSADQRNFTVSVAPTADGAVNVSVAMNSAQDAATNGNNASNTFTIESDRTPPTINSISRGTPNGANTNNASVIWEVEFSENVSGLVNGDFTVTVVSGSITGASVTGINVIDGDSAEVTVNTGSGTGVLRLDVLPAASFVDAAGNDYTATFTTGQTYSIKKTAPTVTSIVRSTPTSPTNDATVTWTVTFDSNMAGIVAGDFTLVDVGNNITGEGSVSVNTGSGSTFDVTANAGTSANGQLRLDVLAASGLQDNHGNALTADFTTGEIFVIDTVAPTAPTVTAPAAPATVNAASTTVAGSAEANALVRVYRDVNNNNAIDGGETVVGSQQLTLGATAYSIAAPLTQDAVNNFLVTATDAAGNESNVADVSTITEDSSPPNAPTITSPTVQQFVNQATFTLAGTAEANALVRIYSDDNNNGAIDGLDAVVGSQQLSGGATTFSVVVSLTQNANNDFTATATDAGANESTPANIQRITEDSIAPTASVPDLDSGSDSGSSNSDNLTNDTTPEFIGTTSETFVEVELVLVSDNSVIGTNNTNAGTGWSITASPAFTVDGTIQVFARATDRAGNTSDSANFSFVLDTTAPVVSAPNLTPGSDSGLSNSDDITNLTTLDFIGTAEAGVTVQLREGGAARSGTTVATGGNWALTSNVLTVSGHTLFARATDAAGNVGDSTDLTVTIDQTPPTATLTSTLTGAPPLFTSAAVTTYTLDFNEDVGLPNLSDFEVATGPLITGASVITVATVSGDVYTISVNTGTGDDTLQLNLDATATITDVAGNVMVALPVTGTLINIDKTVPTITNVTSTKANSVSPAAYTAGEIIDIQVSFTEVVFGTGVQELILNTGGGNTRAATSISTNANVITYRYTVQNGDFSTDLDYTSTAALVLSVGTIRDLAGNNADLTLSAPGAAGSLGGNKNLRIDAQVPTLTIAPQSIPEDVIAGSVVFTVSDNISAATDLAVSVLSSSNNDVPLGSISLDPGLTGTNRALLITPNANFNGTTNLVVRVTDQVNNQTDVPVTITVSPVNDAPVLAGNSAGSPDFSEPATLTDGTAVAVETGLTSSDPDNGPLNQATTIPAGDQTPGTLTVVITNGEQGDVLTVSDAGTVTVAGATVSVSAVAVGTVAGGTNGATPLTVTFNAGTNFAQAQAVMRAITYRSVSQRPAANARTINFTLTDASGAASAVQTESVVVLEGNDPVTITSSGKLPVVTFDASFATDQIPGVALPGQTLTFTIDGKDTDDPITFEWDFGDGTTAFTTPSPNNNVLLNDGSIVNFSANNVTNTVTHTFAKSGIYTVKVVAKDSRTSDDTSATLQIIVNSPPRLVPDTGGGLPPDAERGLTALTDFLKLGQPQTYTVFLSGLSATTDEDGDPLTFTFDLGDGTTVTQGSNLIDKIYPLLPQQAVLQPNGLSSIVVNVTITDTPAQVGIPAGSLTLQRQIFFTEPITGAAVDDIDVFNPTQGLKAMGINSQGNRGAVIQFDVVNAINPRLQIIPVGAETGPAKDFYSPAQDAIPGLAVTNSPAGTFRYFVQFKKAGMYLAQITDSDGRVVRKMIPVTQPDISGAERELQDFNVQASFITGKLNFGTQKQDQLAFRARFPLVDNSLYTFDRTKDFELVVGIGNISCTLNVTPKGKATIVAIRDAKGVLRQPSKGSAVRFKAPKSTSKEALAKNPKLVQAIVDFKLVMEDIELAGLDTEGVTQEYGLVKDGATVLNTGGLFSGQTGDSKIDVKDTGVEVTETMVTLKKNSFVPIGIQALFLVDRQLAYASKIPAGFVTKKTFGQLAGKK